MNKMRKKAKKASQQEQQQGSSGIDQTVLEVEYVKLKEREQALLEAVCLKIIKYPSINIFIGLFF